MLIIKGVSSILLKKILELLARISLEKINETYTEESNNEHIGLTASKPKKSNKNLEHFLGHPICSINFNQSFPIIFALKTAFCPTQWKMSIKNYWNKSSD